MHKTSARVTLSVGADTRQTDLRRVYSEKIFCLFLNVFFGLHGAGNLLAVSVWVDRWGCGWSGLTSRLAGSILSIVEYRWRRLESGRCRRMTEALG